MTPPNLLLSLIKKIGETLALTAVTSLTYSAVYSNEQREWVVQSRSLHQFDEELKKVSGFWRSMLKSGLQF